MPVQQVSDIEEAELHVSDLIEMLAKSNPTQIVGVDQRWHLMFSQQVPIKPNGPFPAAC
jgi:hypothetical protein